LCRSLFVQLPIPGRRATPARVDDGGADFRAFSRSPQVYLNEAGEMIEFEVMIRPIRALTAPGEEIGNWTRPQLARLKQSAGASG
jgi:hypothetical protein